MKLVILLLTFLITFTKRYICQDVAYITGGNFATINDAPWQATIFLNGRIHCGATIIDEKWILSATHCFFFNILEPPSAWSVVVGTDDLSDLTKLRYLRVKRLIHYPKFNSPKYMGDISLMELMEPIKFPANGNAPQSIKLADKFTEIDGSTCAIFGHGATKSKFKNQQRNKKETPIGAKDWWSSKLKRAEVPLIKEMRCQKMHCVPTTDGEILPVYHSNLCAGQLDGSADACQGDSGGGLTCTDTRTRQKYLVGIISHGEKCGLTNRPGLYTKIASYLNWISFHTKIEFNNKEVPKVYVPEKNLGKLYYMCPM